MDWHNSKLNGTVFDIQDWLTYLRDQAASYRINELPIDIYNLGMCTSNH